jgi:Cu(I)/Ag(I) efflux system membrane fusion protein
VLSVPESAVIDTGTKKVVYVETEPGLYDARAVELGPRSGNYYPVLAGLTLGQKIVTQGSFLIDAEARLNPAAAGVSATDGSAAGSEGGGTGHQHGG